MLKVTGYCCLSPADTQNLDRFYNQSPPLTEKEEAYIFSTICRITSVWAIIVGAMPIALGAFGGCSLALTGHFFTIWALPPIALLVGGIMLWHFSLDILNTADVARRIAHEGGVEDYCGQQPNRPFAVNYLTYNSSYPKICAWLIRKVKPDAEIRQ